MAAASGKLNVIPTGGTTTNTLATWLAGIVRIGAFGNVDGTGASDSSAVFSLAYAASISGETIEIPYGKYRIDTVPIGVKEVLWRVNGSTNSNGTQPLGDFGLPGVTEGFWSGAKSFIKNVSTPTDYALLRSDYISSHSGGNAVVNGNFVPTTVVSGAPNTYAWNVNAALFSTATGTGQHCALAGSAFRTAIPSGGSGNMAPIWGVGVQVVDQTGQPSSISGVLTNELDCYANGIDDGTSVGIRGGLDIVCGRWDKNGAAAEIGFGLRINNEEDSAIHNWFKRGIIVKPYYSVAGIDLSSAIPVGTYATAGGTVLGSIVISANQRLSWAGDGSVWSSYDGTSWQLTNNTNPIIQATISTGLVSIPGGMKCSAPIFANNSLSVNGNIVLGAITQYISGAGSSTATLTNSPTSGNPSMWLPVFINGTQFYIPAWL